MSASEDLIKDFSVTVAVKRFDAGAYVNGVYQPGLVQTFTIDMSVQPLTGKELLNLPEAQRTRRQLKGYTAALLQTADQATSKKADLITYAGSDFEVQEVERWEGDLDHYKIRIAEVNP